ncbi:hypothetical protein [Desulfogranum japonicum]|uniref:hypothetical protein n=1 Tax=Desulfogranum japonicum TaxID=231447 RepID=UPI00048D215B|nr:hypothetical protein [Desulfogranum japonicum]
MAIRFKNDKKVVVAVISISLAIGGWTILNPSSSFGLSIYAFTTFNKIPYIYCDLEIDTKGKVKVIKKSHLITEKEIETLVKQEPEILILSTGWAVQ